MAMVGVHIMNSQQNSPVAAAQHEQAISLCSSPDACWSTHTHRLLVFSRLRVFCRFVWMCQHVPTPSCNGVNLELLKVRWLSSIGVCSKVLCEGSRDPLSRCRTPMTSPFFCLTWPSAWVPDPLFRRIWCTMQPEACTPGCRTPCTHLVRTRLQREGRGTSTTSC